MTFTDPYLTTDDNDETDEEPQVPEGKVLIDKKTEKQLRQTAEGRAEAEARAAQAERKLALVEAGIPLNTPLGAMFADAYKGELNAEQITAEWQKVAPQSATASQPEPEPAPTFSEADKNQARERHELATGAANEAPQVIDPIQKAIDQGLAARDAGGTRDDSIASGIASLVESADAGDPRVLVQPGQVYTTPKRTFEL